MMQKNSKLNIPTSDRGKARLEATISQFQADLVLNARMWAADEISAEVVHQLNEPLTALLLYLNGIKEQSAVFPGTQSIPCPMREMIDNAIRETERFSDIVQRIGHAFEMSHVPDFKEARSHEAIELSPTDGLSGQSALDQPALTPRERQVLSLITEGHSNKEGGHRLHISTRTFEVHRAHIMGKLGARNAADLVRITLRDLT